MISWEKTRSKIVWTSNSSIWSLFIAVCKIVGHAAFLGKKTQNFEAFALPKISFCFSLNTPIFCVKFSIFWIVSMSLRGLYLVWGNMRCICDGIWYVRFLWLSVYCMRTTRSFKMRIYKKISRCYKKNWTGRCGTEAAILFAIWHCVSLTISVTLAGLSFHHMFSPASMPKGVSIVESTCWTVVRLATCHFSSEEIWAFTDVSPWQQCHIIKLWYATVTVKVTRNGPELHGRPQDLTAEEVAVSFCLTCSNHFIWWLFQHQFLLGSVNSTCDIYLDELRDLIGNICGADVSLSTVWRTLQHSGYRMKRVSNVSILLIIHSTYIHNSAEPKCSWKECL